MLVKLSAKEVEHVALLGRLALSEEEKERFRAQLSWFKSTSA